MKTNLLTTFRRSSTLNLQKRLQSETSEEVIDIIKIVLKQRGVDIPTSTAKVESFVSKLDTLICKVCESPDDSFKLKVGEILPEKDLHLCTEGEAKNLVKEIEILKKRGSRKTTPKPTVQIQKIDGDKYGLGKYVKFYSENSITIEQVQLIKSKREKVIALWVSLGYRDYKSISEKTDYAINHVRGILSLAKLLKKS